MFCEYRREDHIIKKFAMNVMSFSHIELEHLPSTDVVLLDSIPIRRYLFKNSCKSDTKASSTYFSYEFDREGFFHFIQCFGRVLGGYSLLVLK